MKKTKLMMLAAATLGLAACSNEENVMDNSTPVAMQINASIAGQGLSRTTTDYATGVTSWDKEDAIGIFAMDAEQTDVYSNKKYVTTEGNGTFTYGGTKTAIFVTNATLNYYVYAYYPFEGDEDDEIRNTNTINTGIQGEPKKLDFLFAKVEGITKANLKVDFTGDNAFKHTMSQLILKIKTDATAGFAATDVVNGNYYLSGLKLTGSVSKVSNEAVPQGDVVNGWNFSNQEIAKTPYEDGTDNVRTYRMILFPQDCSKNVITFKATIDSKDYTCTLNPNLKSGNSYTYTINIKKSGIDLSSCTIANWTPNVDETEHDATI